MKTKRAWLAFATIDAMLVVSAGSAMAAVPVAAAAAAPMHLPALLLAGVGLVGCGLRRRPAA
jgi:hypothetical protein